MLDYILPRNNGRTLRFRGDLIGVSSSDITENNDAWTNLSLYLNTVGKFVCHKEQHSIVRGGSHKPLDAFDTKVCSTITEVTLFFGNTPLARELYKDAGIRLQDR